MELAPTVVAVILGVAGPVLSDIRRHALGTPEAEVCACVGAALHGLTDPWVAARGCQRWDAAEYLAARLPQRVSLARRARELDTCPVLVVVRPIGAVAVSTRGAIARCETWELRWRSCCVLRI